MRRRAYSHTWFLEGALMHFIRLLVVCIAFTGIHFFKPAAAADTSPTALSGKVTSAEEGAMEGVLVSAKKAGSTITVTVVTDNQGVYRFPRSRLEPGQYAIRIRAAGYDL